jgi:hypothetical protein
VLRYEGQRMQVRSLDPVSRIPDRIGGRRLRSPSGSQWDVIHTQELCSSGGHSGGGLYRVSVLGVTHRV